MNVRYKENPSAWRNATLFTVLGLLALSTVLRWRHLLAIGPWRGGMLALVCVGLAAWFRPRWFRGYYRLSIWAGFWSSQWVARFALVLLFIVVITPAGVILRLLGKDPLRLKRSRNPTSYWTPAKPHGSFDRLF